MLRQLRGVVLAGLGAHDRRRFSGEHSAGDSQGPPVQGAEGQLADPPLFHWLQKVTPFALPCCRLPCRAHPSSSVEAAKDVQVVFLPASEVALGGDHTCVEFRVFG